MALVQWAYERRRSIGKTKALEQAGDWQRLTEYMIQLSQAHGDHETAAELRKQLRPEPMPVNPVDKDPVYAPEPVKPKARRIRKKPPTPKLTRQQKVDRAWEDLRLARGD